MMRTIFTLLFFFQAVFLFSNCRQCDHSFCRPHSFALVKFDSDSLYLDADLGMGFESRRIVFDHQLRFGYRRFVIGARYTSSFRKDIGSYYPNPQVTEDYYRKLKELAVFGGYRFWEGYDNAWSIVAGPVWRNDEAGYWYSKGAGSAPFIWSEMMKDKSRSIYNQGAEIGMDYMYCGDGHNGGIDVSFFCDIFPHVSYLGAAIDYRFGELR